MEVVIPPISTSWNSFEMSSLSAQMAALEKKVASNAKCRELDTKIRPLPVQEPTALVVSDDMYSSCLRAPPPSLKSDSDLEKYSRANIESRCSNAAAIMMPATEPIQRNTKQQCNESAIQREYDMDTWKMYHRIQSARKSGTIQENVSCSTVRVVSDERRLSNVDEIRGVSFQEEESDFGFGEIFELEMDS